MAWISTVSIKKPEKLLMGNEIYSFDDSFITILDPELELNIRHENLAPPEKEILRYPSGEIYCERFFVKNEENALVLHGPCRYFSCDGELLSKSWMVNGIKQGKFWLYDENKKLSSLQRYVDGQLEGKQEYFYPNGKVKTIMNYRKGVLDGVTLLYFDNGQVKRKIPYKMGKKVGAEQFWNAKGDLQRERHYTEDRLEKEVFYLNSEVKLEERYFHPPHPYYDRIGYYPSGQKALEKFFTGNMYTYKEFDESGHLIKNYSGTFEGGIEWIDFYILGRVTDKEEERFRGINFKVGETVS